MARIGSEKDDAVFANLGTFKLKDSGDRNVMSFDPHSIKVKKGGEKISLPLDQIRLFHIEKPAKVNNKFIIMAEFSKDFLDAETGKKSKKVAKSKKGSSKGSSSKRENNSN